MDYIVGSHLSSQPLLLCRKEVSELFVMSWGSGLTSSLTGSVVGLEGLQTLRKGSSMHRTATTAFKRKSFSLQFKFVVVSLATLT